MRTILMSIRPKYVAKILNGEKTIEVRKRFPKDYRGWVYIYCTKENDLFKSYIRMGYYTTRSTADDIEYNGKGKVVARFLCYKVDQYINGCKFSGAYSDYEYILKPSCLTEDELYDYCEDLSFSAIHISKLEIFDKPKKLCEFGTPTIKLNGFIGGKKPVVKAPQSWQFIEV